MDADITRLLERIAEGDAAAQDALLPLIYAELKRRARSLSAAELRALTSGTTGLLHDCYLRLFGGQPPRFENRRHFFAAAAEAMRRILIERARALARIKRGAGAQHFTLEAEHGEPVASPDEVLLVDELLAQLERHDPQMASVVKLRYFGGLSVVETAEALELSPRSVNRAWTAARAWLGVRLGAGSAPKRCASPKPSSNRPSVVSKNGG